MLPKTGKKFPGGIDRDRAGTAFAKIVAEALVADLGQTHRAAKILMGWTDAAERTVKHWLAGSHGPSGSYLVILIQESDAVLAAIRAAAGRGGTAPARPVSASPGAMSPSPLSGQAHEVRGAPDDRDRGRIRDRDDDRDRAGGAGLARVSGADRRAWFLDALEKGARVAAPELVEAWGVSEKTARRDIAALAARGLGEFVGTRRSGRYRLPR